MRAKLTSRPAQGAFHYLQSLFEDKFSKDDCYKLLRTYHRGGGDGGVTLKILRQACKLKPLDAEALGNTGVVHPEQVLTQHAELESTNDISKASDFFATQLSLLGKSTLTRADCNGRRYLYQWIAMQCGNS